MKKIWLPVIGYEGLYEISDKGEVKSLRFDRILSPRPRYRFNYKSVAVLLTHKSNPKEKQISRLVAEAFIANPENKPCVNHKDNDATNNKVDNLEWVTHQENTNHSTSQKRMGKKYRTVGVNFLRNKEKQKILSYTQ